MFSQLPEVICEHRNSSLFFDPMSRSLPSMKCVESGEALRDTFGRRVAPRLVLPHCTPQHRSASREQGMLFVFQGNNGESPVFDAASTNVQCCVSSVVNEWTSSLVAFATLHSFQEDQSLYKLPLLFLRLELLETLRPSNCQDPGTASYWFVAASTQPQSR